MGCIKEQPLEREQEESRTMVASSDRAPLHCFISAVTVLSAEKREFLSLPFYFLHVGNVFHPKAVSWHGTDPRLFHKQIRSLENFLASDDCKVDIFTG